jgi:hypothetical protein
MLAGPGPAACAGLSDPNQGPGGPILVITSPASTYGKYYAEILRTEGFNEFAVMDIGSVTSATLSGYDIAILAPAALTPTQAGMLMTWVNAGGNLIAMQPDQQLASLLGLTAAGPTLSNAYLLVDTSTAAGNGITNRPLQFHGTANLYTLSGATQIAALYTNFTTPTSNPAVTLIGAGPNGGHAAAFAYDLATSIVYMRQGNPAWAAQERDGVSPIRPDDKFYGAATGDIKPDWVDLANEVSIPQGDEQQRLLANLIVQMNLSKRPLPRFWYFPNGKKAVVIMTGDDHGNGGTAGRFDQYLAASRAGCNVAKWECIRSTSYIYVEPENLTDAQAASYTAQGFEVGLHINTDCADFTSSSLNDIYTQQVPDFTSTYRSVPAPATQRHHCIAWSDWLSAAKTELSYGMRLDTSYYFWPPSWVNDNPGHFTGSAMPMRFADLDGTIVDVYNATTQMTDESGQSYPYTSDALLSAALGPQGFYGAFTVNAHTDSASNPVSDGVLSSAVPRNVPVVSSVQMLNWLDARNASSFGGLTWSGTALTFTITQASGANGLQAMLPFRSAAGVLTSITGTGGSVPFTTDTIKGIPYGFFSAATGVYTATYVGDTTPPVVTATAPANGATSVSQSVVVTATFSEALDPATVSTASFVLRDSSNAIVPATVAYTAATQTAALTPSNSLAASSTYTATLTTGIKDLSGNALATSFVWSFTTAAGPVCPCSAWSGSATPGNASVSDPNAVELGVKFRVDLNGFITGIRFYKGASNTGTHIGNLWTSSGQLLATATFTGESASGWQQLTFGAPVAVNANAVYVASYHTDTGNYAADNGYFANSGVDSFPVHLLQDGASGGDGVYAYGSTSFPSNTYQSSNYWVDVVFALGASPSALSVSSTNPAAGATGVSTSTTVSATFSNSIDGTTISASTFQLKDAANNIVPAAYSTSGPTITLAPTAVLSVGMTYTATLTSGIKDITGKSLNSTYAWSFVTAGVALPEPAGWFTGDMHVHRSCGSSPEAVSAMFSKMNAQNIAVMSLLADSGNAEVQNATTDLPLVNGQDASISTPGRILHWDTEWHWDATYSQYAHQALGGHVVGLGMSSARQVWYEYTQLVLDWIHGLNGIGGFAHMQYLDGDFPSSLTCCTPIEYPVEVAMGNADFISEDVDDSGASFSMNPEAFTDAYYKLLNTGFRPGFAAGTDYPCNSSRPVGSLLTYVQVAGGQLTYGNWIQGIKAGRTVVSRNGHNEFLNLTVNGTATPGDQLSFASGTSVPVTVQWSASQSLSGSIELVSNGVVVASTSASVAPGAPVSWNATVNFPASGWVAARRMGADGHQVHTAAVFVIINGAPIRASAADAQYYVQWMNNLLTNTSPGGAWNSFFPTSLAQAQTRYSAAKAVFQQRAIDAGGANPLAVTSTAPLGGATGVSTTTAVSATFNNNPDTTTISASTFTLTDPSSVAVAGTYAVTGNTATLSPSSPLAPSTTYTATLTTAVKDVNGTALAANYTWSFTTGTGASGCVTNCTIWPLTAVPAKPDDGPDSSVELGVKFTTDTNGSISGIRFHKSPANTGTHVGSLWSATGQLLSSATFTAETASGWQQVTFSSPVSVTANTVYVASYHTAVGHYSDDQNYFTLQGVDSAPLHALKAGVSGANGVFAYGAGSVFPNQNFNSSNYWVDAVFNSAAPTASSATALTSSGTSSVFGQAVTFTAAVTPQPPATGTPTGSVTFKDGTSTLGTTALSAGQASFTTSALTAGSHSVTAVYGGDAGFSGSTSAALPQTVNAGSSTTSIVSAQNPSASGQLVTFTATVSAVAPAAGTPTGSVNFSDGGVVIGTATLSSGQALFSTSTLAVGSHSITATYTGDTNFTSSSTLAPLAQTVNIASSTTALTSSQNPSTQGQSVTFTATVSAVAPGSGTPTGSVTFKDGAATLAAVALSGGVAALSTSSLGNGGHSITAVYGGDSNFSASTSAVMTQTVSGAASTTTVASSPNPSTFGQSVTFSATVSATAPATGTPTGSVTFKDGSTVLGTGTLNVGTVTFSTSTLAVGSHSITAVYGGDTNFSGSASAALTQTVTTASSTTNVTSSQNPSVSGQVVMFTAAVSAMAPATGTPTGTVTFKDGATTLGSGTLSGGTTTFSTSALIVGGHSITAVYGGNSSFSGSTSVILAQTVTTGTSASTLASSANPSVLGQAVTFTATVTAVAPASGTPTGTVTFMDGTATLGTGTLSAGRATFSTSALTQGSHSITAVYGGNTSFSGTTSAVLVQTVNQAAARTTVASSLNPSRLGQTVTFTATVTAVAPATGTPTGTVTFRDGSNTLATGTLSAGRATFSTSALTVGSHSITAVYSGDSIFSGSTSAALAQTVNTAASSTAVVSSQNPTVFGQTVTFTATVTPVAPATGTPTGSVTFRNGTTTIGTGTLSGGVATFSTSSLAIGNRSITAVYGGDINFAGSTSAAVTQTINKATTTAAVVSSQNPSTFGQSVTLTATITTVAPGTGTPAGSVTFMDGTVTLRTATLSGGQATFTTSALSVAAHSITVVYAGNTNFVGSSASPGLTQTVSQSSTTTALTSSRNPSTSGQQVTFTATVSAKSPGSGTPTGSVTFTDGAVTLGTATLSSGRATLAISTLSRGTHSITAAYGGSSSFAVSTSNVVTQTVQ